MIFDLSIVKLEKLWDKIVQGQKMSTNVQGQGVKMAQGIMAKLRKQQNRFIEHIDGNTLNDAASNLRWCRFEDWLNDTSKKIDWVCYVTKKERVFVENNVANFRVLFDLDQMPQ